MRPIKVMIIFLLIFSSINIFSASTLKPLTITVGEWPPFITESHNNNGFIADLIQDIFKEAGYMVTFNFVPWSRSYKTAAAGRSDATALWLHNTKRENDFYYSAPVLQEEFFFFYLSKNKFDWNSLDDLKQFKISTLLGTSYGEEFDAAAKEMRLHIEEVPTLEQSILSLLASRVAITPLEKHVAFASIKKLIKPDEINKITYHPKPLFRNYSYILFPKALPESQKHISAFNKKLTEYRQDGRYQSYFDRFKNGEYELDKAP